MNKKNEPHCECIRECPKIPNADEFDRVSSDPAPSPSPSPYPSVATGQRWCRCAATRTRRTTASATCTGSGACANAATPAVRTPSTPTSTSSTSASARVSPPLRLHFALSGLRRVRSRGQGRGEAGSIAPFFGSACLSVFGALQSQTPSPSRKYARLASLQLTTSGRKVCERPPLAAGGSDTGSLSQAAHCLCA